MHEQTVLDRTRRWIATFVIGLDLCPFARQVFESDRIRYAVTHAHDEAALLQALAAELRLLTESPRAQIEATVLIHPRALAKFLDYNDFLPVADDLLGDMRLRGTIQIASFHPDYQFAGTDPAAAENYTNRSPYPMLHLLREDSISQVAGDPEQLAEIPRRNVATMRRLGLEEIRRRLREIE